MRPNSLNDESHQYANPRRANSLPRWAAKLVRVEQLLIAYDRGLIGHSGTFMEASGEDCGRRRRSVIEVDKAEDAEDGEEDEVDK